MGKEFYLNVFEILEFRLFDSWLTLGYSAADMSLWTEKISNIVRYC